MKIECPNCKGTITVSGLGRKSLPITFNNVSKALQLNNQGRPDLTNTALAIEEKTGIKVSPAFVLMRLRKEASARGIKYDKLVTKIGVR